MLNNSPLFSIVIPTRNRGHLLSNALRSAINQQFDDYEIVVVANDCQDNTKEVVQNMMSGRVRYVETDAALSMPDNWEFAWTQAKGKYVTFLCDDDALIPTALKLLAEKALDGNPPIVSWEDAIYYYPNWSNANLQNILLLFFFGTTLVQDIDSNVMRMQLAKFDFAWSSSIPKMLNCIANREFFENWRKRFGRLFYPVSPDFAFAWIAVHVSPFIRVVNYPISVRGITDNSIGSNGGFGEAAETFFEEFGEFEFFAETQLDIPLSMNHVADTYMRSSVEFHKHAVEETPIDQQYFCIALAKQLHENRYRLPEWNRYVTMLLRKSELISPALKIKINDILLQPQPSIVEEESIRALHKRTQTMALEYLPNIQKEVQRHSGDLQAALATLGLRDDVLADANWTYLYLFGDVLHVSDIYTMSLYVDRYYDFLMTSRANLNVSLEKIDIF